MAVLDGVLTRLGASLQPVFVMDESNSTGISSGEFTGEEARGRREHPAVDTNSRPLRTPPGRVGDEPLTDIEIGRLGSNRAADRLPRKRRNRKYSDRPMPASTKVDGSSSEPAQGAQAEDNRE